MTQKAIKLVAADEDGTFLRDHVHYDIERFERVFARMRAAGTHFVVATGNQSYQVQNLFPTHTNDMGIVSANGAYVLDGGEPVFAARATDESVAHMLAAMRQTPDVPFAMLGVAGAYVERGVSQEFFDDMAHYCHRLYWVDSLADVDDQVFMFSSVVEEARVGACIAHFRAAVGDQMDVVGSGEGYFDVVCPGITKATGLQVLMERWGVEPDECIAFGDSENDLAMFGLVGCAYAMANAPADVQAAADRIAPPNTEDGVLQVLEALFA